MLKKIERSALKENMRFSAPVFFDDGEYMLVNEGVPLHKKELDALARWDIPYVLTSGFEMKEGEELPEPEEMEELVDDNFENSETYNDNRSGIEKRNPLTGEQIIKLPEVLKKSSLYSAYEGLINKLDVVFSMIKKQQEIKARAVDGIVNDLFNLVKNERVSMVGYILGGSVAGKDLAKNGVNSAIISMIIAESLHIPDVHLMQIITGALLHDVGMLRIDDSILNKEGKLSESETTLIQAHTTYGYKIIVNNLFYPEEVGLIAARHHERWDGKGYPSGISGKQIDIASRIVSAADAFEAMVSPRIYRGRLLGYDAMKNLVADNARRFDPDIVKAMIQNMGIYPIGSIVLMNNSVIARVVEACPQTPLRPKIKVLIDEFGQVFPDNKGDLIDLKTNRTLFIVRAVNPSESRHQENGENLDPGK